MRRKNPNAKATGWSTRLGCAAIVMAAAWLGSKYLAYQRAPGDGIRDQTLSHALALAQNGQLSAAISMLEQRRKDGPLDPEQLKLLGGLYGNMGDMNKSIEALQEATEQAPASADLWLDLALSHARKRDYNGVLTAVGVATKQRLHEQMIRRVDGLAALLYRHGAYPECVRLCAESLAAFGHRTQLQRYLALGLLELGRFVEAQEVLGTWRATDPKASEYKSLYPSTFDVEHFVAAMEKLVPVDGTILHATKPKIIKLEHVLSVQECHQLVSASSGLVKPSSIGSGLHSKHRSRQSQSVSIEDFASPGKQLWTTRLAAVLATVTGLAPEVVELGLDAQIVRYQPGEFYAEHYDSSMVMRRVLTFLIVLNDGFSGGSTTFRGAGLQVPKGKCGWRVMEQCFVPNTMGPNCDQTGLVVNWEKPGDGVIWYNHLWNSTQDPYAMHAGCEVTSGEKWILSLWLQLNDRVINALMKT